MKFQSIILEIGGGLLLIASVIIWVVTVYLFLNPTVMQ